MRFLFGLLLGVILAMIATTAEAAKRAALVFSVQKYDHLRPLTNPGRDAQLVAATLEGLGFDVTVEQDRNLVRMRRALEDFREDAAGAEIAFVYYAGHGVEIGGENRLLPVDANASSLQALKDSSLPLEEVRAAAMSVAPAVLLVLDACRDDPFGQSAGEGRSAKPLAATVMAAVKPGLGRTGEAENTLFVFSAAPGRTAADGNGQNSTFSAALAKYLPTAGVEIRSALTLVQQEVHLISGGTQSPYVENAPFPSLFFAADSGELPERERLLLAMADLTPALRDEVERIAAETAMPLAPLYGALIAADLKSLTQEDRQTKLAESAQAYRDTRGKLAALSSADPEVTRLRGDAENSLALGAFAEARATLAAAADIDARSGDMLAANLVERRLSEAATHAADAGVARTQLDHAAAISALERAASLHEKVAAEAVPDSARQTHDWLLADLGDLHVLTGDTAKALGAYQRMRKAAELRVATEPGEPDAKRDLLVSWSKIGDVKVKQGDLAGAVKAYADSLAIVKTLAARDPDNIDWQRDLSVSLDRIGDVKAKQGDLTGALKAYSDGRSIGEKMVAREAVNGEWQRDLVISWTKIGDVKAAQDDQAGALKAYEAGLAIAKTLVARDGGNLEWQHNLSASWHRIGIVKTAQGELASALQAHMASLAIVETLVARDPGNAGWQRDLSVNWERIGDVKMGQGDLAGALKAYTDRHAITQTLVARDPGNAEWQRDLSTSWNSIGDVKAAQGDPASALKAYKDGLAIREMLAASDASNAEWQRGLIVSHVKLAQIGENPRSHYAKALDIAKAMEKAGVLAPADAFIPGLLRDALAKLQ